MTWIFTHFIDIWLPLFAAVSKEHMGLLSWRRSKMPCIKRFDVISNVNCRFLLGIARATAIVIPAVKIDWYKFHFALKIPATIAGTLFTPACDYPGRWLTRCNLVPLKTHPLFYDPGFHRRFTTDHGNQPDRSESKYPNHPFLQSMGENDETTI